MLVMKFTTMVTDDVSTTDCAVRVTDSTNNGAKLIDGRSTDGVLTHPRNRITYTRVLYV